MDDGNVCAIDILIALLVNTPPTSVSTCYIFSLNKKIVDTHYSDLFRISL